MKKTIWVLSAIAAMFLFAQCKKDSTTAAASVNFSPLTAATNWTYKYSGGSSAPGTYTVTVTNNDTVVNGKTYKVLSNSDGTHSYLSRTGSDYFRLASFPSLGINNFQELYLKDDKALNETWAVTTTVMYSGFPVPVNLNYTIKGKGDSRTVNGNSFTKVTYVRLDISLLGSPSGGGDFYYQEGVGLIEDNISISAPNGQTYATTEQIVSYQIK